MGDVVVLVYDCLLMFIECLFVLFNWFVFMLDIGDVIDVYCLVVIVWFVMELDNSQDNDMLCQVY